MSQENKDFDNLEALLDQSSTMDRDEFDYEINQKFDKIFGQKIENEYANRAFIILIKLNNTRYNDNTTYIIDTLNFTNLLFENPDIYLQFCTSIEKSRLEEKILNDYSCLNTTLRKLSIRKTNWEALICFAKKNIKYAKEGNLSQCLKTFLQIVTYDPQILTDYHYVYELYKIMGGQADDEKMSFSEIKESVLTLVIKLSYPLNNVAQIANATLDKSFKDGSEKTALYIFLEKLVNYSVDKKKILMNPEKVYEIYTLLGGIGTDGIMPETDETIITYSLRATLPVDTVKDTVGKYRLAMSYRDKNNRTAIDHFKTSSFYSNSIDQLYTIFPRISIDQINYDPKDYSDEIKKIELIAGVGSFYIYKKEQQIIYLFGELHYKTDNLYCNSSLVTDKMHYMTKVLKKIFELSKDRNEIIDYFQEADAYLRLTTEERKGIGSHGAPDKKQLNSGTMSNIMTEFENCFYKSLDTTKLCPYNVRFHFSDTRHEYRYILSDKFIETEINSEKKIYLQVLKFICSIGEHDSSLEKIKKSKFLSEVFAKIKTDGINIDKLCGTMFELPKIKKQLNASYYSNEIKEFVKNKCTAYYTSTSLQYTKYQTGRYVSMGSLLMDTYLLARVFRTYQQKNVQNELYQQKSNKVIIHAGEHHIRNYINFLENIGFEKKYGNTNIEINDKGAFLKTPNKLMLEYENQCINISDMNEDTKQGLFDMNIHGGDTTRSSIRVSYLKNKRMYNNLQ